MLTWQICRRLMLIAALLFACSYQVWANAVVTELYGLSTLLGLLACVLFWQWHLRNRTSWLIAGLIVSGLSLAAWLPMALLTPAVIWLLWSRREQFMRNLLWSAAIMTAALLAIIALNVWLALRLPPHGPDLPLSAEGMFRYLTGAMHEPLAVRDAGFFAGRIAEHLAIFARSFLWVGFPLGVLGVVVHVSRDRVFGLFLLALFVIQMSYFTLFGSGDYYSMVMLSYALFSLWIVIGTLWIANRSRALRPAMIAVLACLPALQAWQQLPQRLAAGAASPAQNFVDTSFAGLPANTLAIAGWQQFAALDYGQLIQKQRPDLQLILPATTPRHYGTEVVPDYLGLIAASYCSRPVYTHKVKPELEARYVLRPVAEPEGWYRVIDEQADCEAGATGL